MKNLSFVNLINVTILGTSATGFLCISLLDASIKSLLLLVLSTIVCWMLVRASAATRHWVWASTMIGLLLMPACALLLPEWRVLPSWLSLESRIEQQLIVNKPIAINLPASDDPVLSQQTPAPEYANYTPPTVYPSATDPTATMPIPMRLSASLLLSVWGIGCLLCLIPIAISLLRLRQTERVYKDGSPLPQRLLRRITKIAGELGIGVPRVIVGPTGVMPMVWTFGESRLLMPADTEQWTTTRLDAVLMHELVHLKRRDPTWFLVGLLARAVNWFNPLAWYAVHRLRIECERACDDHVLRMGVDAADYATHLLALSTSVRALSGTGSIALAMATKLNVENRIVSILNEKANRCGVTLRRAVGVLIAISIGVAVLASLAATASDKNSADEKDEEIQLKYPYCVVVVDDLKPRSLAEAVAAFNKDAKESPTGALQPPITEQETLAAIAKFTELEHVEEPTKATLREIAKTKSLPVNAYFRRFTRFDDEQQMRGVWWVRLVVEGKDPPDYSVPVRTTQVFARPYTQMERQQNAEPGLALINRFVSYFEEQPNIRLKEAFAQEAMDRLIGVAKKGIEAKDLDVMKELFHWQDVSDSTREFVSSELQMLFKATIHSIKIEPRTLNGNLIHWSAFQHYQPNLPVVGFLEIEYTPEDPLKPVQMPSGPNKVFSLELELGKFGNEFRLVNYINLGERNLPKGRVDGLSMRGYTEPLADGTYLLTNLITNPGSLISAHLANEEIRQRGFENQNTKGAHNSKRNYIRNIIRNSVPRRPFRLTGDNLRKMTEWIIDKWNESQIEDVQDFQGRIVEVSKGGDTVWINLGRADGLRPGVRFGVVNSDESRVADAQPKAKIEVVEVLSGSEHLSRCKVLSNRTPATILRGDSIYSPTWQPGRHVEFELDVKMDIDGDEIDDRERVKAMIEHHGGLGTVDLPLVIGDRFKVLDAAKKVEFALVGKMDIDGDGIDDRERLKAMIEQHGGRVTVDLPPTGKGSGELSVTTRWMVIGDDFKVFDEGGILESKAKSLGISRIKLDKLLGWLRGTRTDEHRP